MIYSQSVRSTGEDLGLCQALGVSGVGAVWRDDSDAVSRQPVSVLS